MNEQYDFERSWLDKFSKCIDEIADENIRRDVLRGSENLTMESSHQDVFAWSKVAMERLDQQVDEKKCQDILMGCACQYPKVNLQDVRMLYEENSDIDEVLVVLQYKFVEFLEHSLNLEKRLIGQIVQLGMGLAGVRKGNTIVATKIPKSGFLEDYFSETDPLKRRQMYCHCPRVRDSVTESQGISETYCYCGAGYYKGIWEEILQQEVEVELLESILMGNEFCTVAISLPD